MNRTSRTTVFRDRHGRGLRLPLLPADLPGFRSRAESFDQIVMDAVADIEERWPGQLDSLEFAVDDVPAVSGDALSDDFSVTDDGVPLARYFPPGVDRRGRPTRARIVAYRRPLELRATDHTDLLDLVTEVLAEQVASVLGGGLEP